MKLEGKQLRSRFIQVAKIAWGMQSSGYSSNGCDRIGAHGCGFGVNWARLLIIFHSEDERCVVFRY